MFGLGQHRKVGEVVRWVRLSGLVWVSMHGNKGQAVSKSAS